MNKPAENRDKPMDVCKCGRPKKVMSKYCVKCSSDINRLRIKIRNHKAKDGYDELKKQLQRKLELYK